MVAYSCLIVEYYCMNERLGSHETQEENIERLELKELLAGDVVQIVTGVDDEAWVYDFTVENPSGWPTGTLQAKTPDGNEVGETGFSLHGAGRWTTRQQNPVQQQERAFTSHFDCVFIGGYMTGKFDDEDDRAVFDSPGQAISAIRVHRADEL